jgi:hypothetical protein
MASMSWKFWGIAMSRTALRERSRFSAYEQVRPRMKTGDVVAFSGKSRTSKLICWATGSFYSHVGLVLVTDLGWGFGQTVLLVESTTAVDLPDVLTREVRKGIQMHLLSQRLDAYWGSAWWVALREPLEPEGLDRMTSWLRQTHCRRAPYDTLQAIGAGMDLLDAFGLANERDFDALFCSELVGCALQLAGVLPDTLNPSELTPGDLVALPCFEQPVLLKGHHEDGNGRGTTSMP